MSYLVVLPAIDVFLTRACLRHISVPGDNLLLIDNTPARIIPGDTTEAEPGGRVWDFHYIRPERNAGVAASWNFGVKKVLSDNRDWLIVLSCAFIPFAGLLDLVGRLPEHPEPFRTYHTIYGWHCRPIHRTQLEAVGSFDSDFYPAYLEDADFDYRSRLLGWDSPSFVRVAGLDLGAGHGVQLVSVDEEAMQSRYVAKWNGPPGQERYTVPFAAHSHRDAAHSHNPV